MTGQDICDFIHEHQFEDAIIYNPDKCGPVTLEDNIKVKEDV